MSPTSQLQQRVLAEEETPQTIAELVYYLPTREYRVALEEFRQEYELQAGATDITKRYTSTLPQRHQEWLIKNHPQIYFDGLPEFAQAYLKSKIQSLARNGRLDAAPDHYLQVFVSGGMNSAGGQGHGR